MSGDSQLLKTFKEDPENLAVLAGLSGPCKEILIDSCFTSLFQKAGNQALASNVLHYFGLLTTVAGSNVYIGPKEPHAYQSLKRVGVAVVPVIPPKEIASIREAFKAELRGFPEYRRSADNPDVSPSGNPIVYVLGGFAALGNPASFHNPLVRKIRMRCYKAVTPLLRTVVARSKPSLRDRLKVQVLFDRMMNRLPSQQAVPESFHRDVVEADEVLDDDEIYGGWINLDNVDQYFSFVPGSHLGLKLTELEKGFAAIPEDQVKVIGTQRERVAIPPGHMILFPQYILHEVVAQKAKHEMMRLFLGWRITVSDLPMNHDLRERMTTQAIMRIPGGMYPPMYASNHGSYFLRKQFRPIPDDADYKVNTIEWSEETMRPRTLVNKPAKGTHPPYKIVARYMDSLKSYQDMGTDTWMYPPYTEEESLIYFPHRMNT